jgi:hemoglobin/transferrin/lactoferrin receptor protein
LYDNTWSKVFTSTNAGKAYIYGMSLKVVLELNDNFRLINDFSYTYGRIVTDSTPYPLDHIPPAYGRISLQYTQKKLKAELYVLFNGWKKVKDYNMFGEDNFTSATKDGTPAWATLNFRMGYQITKGLQIQCGIENIFDRHYRYFASGVSAAGRNIFFTLRGSI